MAITICRNWNKRPGCLRVAVPRTGLCAACLPAAKAETRQAEDARRLSAPERGYTADWNELSKIYRAAHPVCEVPGCGRATAVCDHLIALAVAPERRLDVTNLWALCRNHHRVKTLIEVRLGLVREGDGGRASAGIGVDDLARLHIMAGGVSYRADEFLGRTWWWSEVLTMGVESVRGQWRVKA